MNHRLLPIALLCLIALACNGGGSPSEPSPAPQPNLSGYWTGTLTLTLGGSGSDNFVMNLVHAGNGGIVGNWGLGNYLAGSLVGTTTANSIALEFAPSTPGTCPFRATGSWGSTFIRANWTNFRCSVSRGGTLEVFR